MKYLTENRQKEIYNSDLILFKNKLTHFIPESVPSLTFHCKEYPFFPYFQTVAETEKNASKKTAEQLIGDYVITHYLTTHEGRRFFKRMSTYYHINRLLVDALYPFGMKTICNKYRAKEKCCYHCREFFQSCDWHLDMPYDPIIRTQRDFVYQIYEAVLQKPEFWLSLLPAYYSQATMCQESEEETPELTNSFVNQLIGKQETQAEREEVPECEQHENVTTTNKKDGRNWSLKFADGYSLNVKSATKNESVPDEYGVMQVQTRCFECSLDFRFGWEYIKHLRSEQHAAMLKMKSRLGSTREKLSETYSKYMSSASEKLGRARAKVNEYMQSDPVNSARDYFSEKLESLLQTVSDIHSSLPEWLRTHMRFIVNIMCGVVTIVFSKRWIAVLSAITSMVNEILHEFPQLLRSKLDSLVECFKQVIRKFFPGGQQAQAQPTAAQDDQASNESFIRSLFGILSSILPGVTVDAGLLKARVQRIQMLASCLNALKTLGEWCATLFDKLWEWVQIYWYGATSADLARARTLLKHPDIQVWINDIQAFELGKDEKGQLNPGVTRLLTSTDAQETVLELKRRGEEIYRTLCLSDDLKNAKVTHMVQMYLRKVEKWYQTFEDTRGLAENKHEPFIIYLYGDPGVGKTFCANYLCQALAHAENRPFSSARDVFSKPRASEYYDGYNNHYCFLLDDFMQVNEPQTNASEVSLLIDAGSRSKLHLDMAALEKKATSYFTSPLIVITSNKHLNRESFEGIVTEYSALARRIDMAIEVRKRDDWQPAGKGFDPSGMYFHATKFRLNKNISDGGEWINLMQPADWGTLIQAASLLYMRKRKRQFELDIDEPLAEKYAQRIERTLRNYLDMEGTDAEVLERMMKNETTSSHVQWRYKTADEHTGNAIEKLAEVRVIESTPSIFTEGSSMVSRNKSLENMHPNPLITIPDIRAALGSSKSVNELEETKIERKLSQESQRIRRNESCPRLTPLPDAPKPIEKYPDDYYHIVDYPKHLIPNFGVDGECASTSNAKPKKKGKKQKAQAMNLEAELEQVRAHETTSGLQTQEVADLEQYIRQRTNERREQIVEHSKRPIRCLVDDCDFTGDPRKHVQAQILSHFLNAAHGERSCTDDQRAHQDVYMCELEHYLRQFVDPMSGPLSSREMRLYNEITTRRGEFTPAPSPKSITEYYMANQYNHVRVLIWIYERYYRPQNPVMRILHAVRAPVDAFCTKVQGLVESVTDVFAVPVAIVEKAVNDALDRVECLIGKVGKYALVGLVLALMGAALGACLYRWRASEPATEAEYTKRGHASGNEVVYAASVNRTKKRVEVLEAIEEVEGDGHSGTEPTKAAKRKQKQVEGDAEGDGHSGTEPTKAAKRKQKRVEDEDDRPKCRYVCSRQISPYALGVVLVRVSPTDEHDVKIAYTNQTYRLYWNDGTKQEVSEKDTYLRDMKVCELIETKYRTIPENESIEVESKGDRLAMVEAALEKVPVQETEAARDPTMMDMCRSLAGSVAIVTNMTQGLTLKGFFPCGTALMVPMHLFGNKEPKDCELKVTTPNTQVKVRPGPDYPYTVAEDKDTVFIEMKKAKIMSRRDAVPNFIRSDEQIFAKEAVMMVPMLSTAKDRVEFYYQKQMKQLKEIGKTTYWDPATKSDIEIVKAFGYHGDPEPGDCGSLLFRVEPRAPTKILGFHVAGSSGEGTATTWTQERLREELAKLGVQKVQALPVTTNSIEVEEFFDTVGELTEDGNKTMKLTHVDVIGNLLQQYSPGAPMTTKLRPSPIHNMVVQTQSGPSTQRPFINEAGEKIDPLKIALSKLESRQILFDQKLVDRCAQRMLVDYSASGLLKPYADRARGKLSLEENINGDQNDMWIKPLNMHTSPGYPYVLAGNKELYVDPQNASLHPVLLAAMNEREDMARKGQQKVALMVDTLKDERLADIKREKGKVRIFNVCPLDYNMLVRKYFTRFLGQMMEHHIHGEVSVGINPHGDEWEAFYKSMSLRGDRWLAGDYSAWDKRAPIQIAYAVLPIVEAFYQKFQDYEPEDAVVRRVLIEQAMQSTRLVVRSNKNLVYRVHQSMPSGIAVTAVYNSLINALLFRVIFAELAMAKDGWSEKRAVNMYSKYVAFAAYGDDHVARVSNVVEDWFNMHTVSEQMAKHFITYTSATKEEVAQAFVEDEGLQYLKRKFVNRGGRIDAPMDLIATLDILNWVQSPDPNTAKEACESAVRSVIIELSHHEKEVFDEWYAKIVKACVVKGLEVPIVSHSEVVASRRQAVFDFDDLCS